MREIRRGRNRKVGPRGRPEGAWPCWPFHLRSAKPFQTGARQNYNRVNRCCVEPLSFVAAEQKTNPVGANLHHGSPWASLQPDVQAATDNRNSSWIADGGVRTGGKDLSDSTPHTADTREASSSGSKEQAKSHRAQKAGPHPKRTGSRVWGAGRAEDHQRRLWAKARAVLQGSWTGGRQGDVGPPVRELLRASR